MRPNKKYGFRKFICKIENKELHQRKEYCALPPLEIYNLEKLARSLNNPPEVAHALEELPEEAKDFLKYCLNPKTTVTYKGKRYLLTCQTG